MAGAYRIPLRIIFYRDKATWIAHCLEFDLLGDGPARDAALDNLFQAITIQIEASDEFNNIRNLFSHADDKYLAMFAASRDVARGVLEVRFNRLRSMAPFIDEVVAREFEGSEAEFVTA